MASSRPDAGAPSEPSSVAFALQELAACWSQAYEAMTRGDLAAVAALLDRADEQLAAAGDGRGDSPTETQLRSRAASAHGRLQHAMRAGLEGLREELGRARQGQKVLRGYGQPGLRIGNGVTTRA